MNELILLFQDLVSVCNFHNYDNLRHFAKKLDPRREGGDQRVSPDIIILLLLLLLQYSNCRNHVISSLSGGLFLVSVTSL